jgi:hypothetical protein
MRGAGIEATFAEPGEFTVAKVEQKQRPDLIFEPRYSFTKIIEDVYSLCWFIDSKYELLYGTDTSVKMCDTREYQTHFKALYENPNKNPVLSIKIDPFDSRRFAALTEDTINIYDLRVTRKPLIVISDGASDSLGEQ